MPAVPTYTDVDGSPRLAEPVALVAPDGTFREPGQPSADQDPIFNHAAGVKVAVTTSVALFTPPAGCKFARISTDVDIVVNTANAAAVDDGTAVRIVANLPEVIPVTAGIQVRALSLGASATVRCTPLKAR